MKKILTLLLLSASASAACLASSTPASVAESLYNSMSAPELRITRESPDGQTPIGSPAITERAENGRICRKFEALIPNPTPSYTCYGQTSVGAAAKQEYQAMAAFEWHVTVTNLQGDPLEGVGRREKESSTALCIASFPIVPNAPVTYECYGPLDYVPPGGGITGSN